MNVRTNALFPTPANKRTIAELSELGERLVMLPLYDDVSTDLDETSYATLLDSLQFDWIVFPDIFTVGHFIEFLKAKDFDLFELDSVRICAFGEAVSDRLRFSEIHSDIISSSFDSSRVFDEICEFEGLECVGQRKFLVLKEWESEIDLTNILRKAGAETIEIPIYKLNSLNAWELSKAKALISGGGIEVVILSTAEELAFFEKAFGFSQIIKEDLTFSSASHSVLQMLSERALNNRFYLNPKAAR